MSLENHAEAVDQSHTGCFEPAGRGPPGLAGVPGLPELTHLEKWRITKLYLLSLPANFAILWRFGGGKHVRSNDISSLSFLAGVSFVISH